MCRFLKMIALTCGLSLAGTALALVPLEGRTINGDKVDAYDASAVMIYDPNQDLTWLRDWNVNGGRSWQDQLIWAGSLNVGAFANWSLPTFIDRHSGDTCDASDTRCGQMGYLWYRVLGNAGNSSHVGPFLNMQTDAPKANYWTSTPSSSQETWFFNLADGVNGEATAEAFEYYAVAVRPGDVATAVPEPQIWATLLLGLGAVVLAANRQSVASPDSLR